MKKNNLPEYWCVKNDGNQLFKDTVIKYLNNTYKQYWEGNEENWYYGFDRNKDNNGTNNWYDIENFEKNPTLLTLKEFIEFSNPIKKQTIMIKLTKSQLIDLYNRFNCKQWKENIKEILSENLLTADNELIEIDEKYINLIKTQGTDEQKEYLFNTYNIDLTIKPDIIEFKKLFYEIMEGLIFHKTDSRYEYLNSKKEFMFEFDFKNNIFWYSGVYSIFVNKLGYNEQQINELLTIILEETLKLQGLTPRLEFSM